MNRLIPRTAVVILALGLLLGGRGPIATAQPVATADLAITIHSDQDKVKPGENISYTVTVTNLGPDTATLVGVSHNSPDPLNPVSLTCDRGVTASGPFCEYPTLEAGGSVTSIYVETPCCILPPYPNSIKEVTTSATVFPQSPETQDPNSGNNIASATAKIQGLGLFPQLGGG